MGRSRDGFWVGVDSGPQDLTRAWVHDSPKVSFFVGGWVCAEPVDGFSKWNCRACFCLGQVHPSGSFLLSAGLSHMRSPFG